jgi:hypothetical protein
MKKFLILASALLIILAMAVPVMAATDIPITAYNATIKIDGLLDVDYGPAVDINGMNGGIAGATGQIWTAWDDNHIYFYAEIKDTTPNHENDAPYFRDCIEYFLDWNNNNGTDNANDGQPYWQVRIASAPNGAGEQLTNNIHGTQDLSYNDSVQYVVKPLVGNDIKGGYIVEVAISPAVDGVKLTEGKVIRADFQIADNQTGATRDSQAFLTDQNCDEQFGNPSACHGLITLAEAPVIIETEWSGSETSAAMLFFNADSGTNEGMTVTADSSAFSGKYISSDNAESGITYKFTIAEAGTYYIWARVHHASDVDNSYFFTIDGKSLENQEYYVWDFYENSEYEVAGNHPQLPDNYRSDEVYEKWYWMQMSYRDQNADPNTRFNLMAFDFTAGEHVLYLRVREAWARVDQFIVTNSVDYNPANISGDPQIAYLAEIEAARIAAESAVTDSNASVSVTPEDTTVPTPTAPQTGDKSIVISALLIVAFAIIAANTFRGKKIYK